MSAKISIISEALKNCWIRETSNQPEKWSDTTPSLGQSLVTSMIVNKLFGGIIIRGEVKSGQSHYWNLIGRDIFDLTKEQPEYDLSFEKISQVSLENLLSNKENAKRYEILSKKLKKLMTDSTTTKTAKKTKTNLEVTT